jgi:multidrug resistance efflux pump
VNRGLIAGGAIVAVAAIGLSIGWIVEHRRPKPAPAKPAAISTVFEGTDVTLTGVLQPQVIEQVAAPVAGILDGWFVEVGAEVYEDQLVGRIRNADLDAAVQSAQAALDRVELRIAQLEAQVVSAKLEISRTDADQIRAHNEVDRLEKLYQRYKNLFEVGALPRLTFEKTEADYKSAKVEAASRDTASKDAQEKSAALDRDSVEAKSALAERTSALETATKAAAECDLHSPADGVVLTRDIHQADKVEEKQNLMAIAADLTKLAVSLSPEPRVLARIRAGQHAVVRIGGAELAGEVHEVRGTEVIVWFSSPDPVTTFGAAAPIKIVF